MRWRSRPWDPSVQALAALPDVVKRLGDDIQWTTDLGNAFLAQQSDVMDAVQRMRKKAQDKGTLKTTEQQKVETKVVESKSVIVIEQANPQVVYVPSYDPVVVYGPAYYPYPPIYYPPWGYYAAGAAIAFGVGVMMGAFWGGGWGWGCGWGGNNVYINNNNNFNRNTNINGGNRNNIGDGTATRRESSLDATRGGDRSNWQHNPAIAAARRIGTGHGGPVRRQCARRFAGSTPEPVPSNESGGRAEIWAATAARTQPGSAIGAGGLRRGQSRRRLRSRQRRGAGGADRIGSRDVSRSGGGDRDAFGGGSRGYSGSSARSSSSRGSSSYRLARRRRHESWRRRSAQIRRLDRWRRKSEEHRYEIKICERSISRDVFAILCAVAWACLSMALFAGRAIRAEAGLQGRRPTPARRPALRHSAAGRGCAGRGGREVRRGHAEEDLRSRRRRHRVQRGSRARPEACRRFRCRGTAKRKAFP